MGLEGLEGLEGFKSPLSVQICPTVQSSMCPRYAIFCIAESIEDAYNQSQILTPLRSARNSMAWPSPMGLLGHAKNVGPQLLDSFRTVSTEEIATSRQLITQIC